MEIRISIFEAEEMIEEYLNQAGYEFIKNLAPKNIPNRFIKFDEENECFYGFIVAP